MQVTLSPKWTAFVKKQIKTKKYRNTTELFQQALRKMEEDEAFLQWEKETVAIGLAQADRGELIPVTEELIQGIFSRGRARLAAKRRKSA